MLIQLNNLQTDKNELSQLDAINNVFLLSIVPFVLKTHFIQFFLFECV